MFPVNKAKGAKKKVYGCNDAACHKRTRKKLRQWRSRVQLVKKKQKDEVKRNLKDIERRKVERKRRRVVVKKRRRRKRKKGGKEEGKKEKRNWSAWLDRKRVKSLLTLNYKCNGFFLQAVSRRIASNTHTEGAV